MDDLYARKTALRSRLLAARSALPAPVRDEASAAIRTRARRLPELSGRTTVAGYACSANEVDIDDLLSELIQDGRTVALPRVDGDHLRLVPVADLDVDLRPGFRSIREPLPVGPWVRPEALDAVLAPGVGFDRRGRRLGYGGGHFDRMLARVRPGTVVIGLAFDAQVVDAVPVEPHDRPMDVVVTESTTLRPA
jgi:5-formyltetrahydrofolate cyclo-ligase